MRISQRLLICAAGFAGTLSAVPAGAAGDCIAALHLGQHSTRIVAVPSAEQERLDEYLEFHAHAVEANGGLTLGARPVESAAGARATPGPRGIRTSRRGDIQG